MAMEMIGFFCQALFFTCGFRFIGLELLLHAMFSQAYGFVN
uniref:Uncharacterized protein n=1 Tax=Brassica campestris TaxID=3711 RepID=A0A3P6B4T6_BRACM|nr:unnamed protein product [Brassica rapa]